MLNSSLSMPSVRPKRGQELRSTSTAISNANPLLVNLNYRVLYRYLQNTCRYFRARQQMSVPIGENNLPDPFTGAAECRVAGEHRRSGTSWRRKFPDSARPGRDGDYRLVSLMSRCHEHLTTRSIARSWFFRQSFLHRLSAHLPRGPRRGRFPSFRVLRRSSCRCWRFWTQEPLGLEITP
jgi:hypothetical protein